MARKSHIALSKTQWTILLVDDDVEYTQSTARLLEREGHTIFVAISGAERFKCLKERHVDLLLVDYFMPGMTV